MCPHESGPEPGSLQGPADNRADGTGVGKTTVRRLVPNEQSPCRASRTILAKIGSNGFADIGGKGQAVVIASLPMHGQHASSPVDIVEFQGDDFAGSESQPGQDKKDRVITTGDGRVSAVASLDKSFDLVRRQVFWQLREPPGRHRRHGPGQIRFSLAVLKEKPADGAQSRHHQLGFSWTTRTSVSQDETGNVVGDQLPNTDVFVLETLTDETPEEFPIPGGCYRSKSTFLLEKDLESPLEHGQRRVIDRRPRCWNNTLLTQMLQEESNRSWPVLCGDALGADVVPENS